MTVCHHSQSFSLKPVHEPQFGKVVRFDLHDSTVIDHQIHNKRAAFAHSNKILSIEYIALTEFAGNI